MERLLTPPISPPEKTVKTLSEQNFNADGRMPSTHWNTIRQARADNSAEATQALEFLCRAYWYPLYAYLRRAGESPHQAQDLIQGFFARILSHDSFSGVKPIEGTKFRSWLLSSLRHFVHDEWRKAQAERRGGGATIVSIHADEAEHRYENEPFDPTDPAKLFERKWAMELLKRVLARLEERYAIKGKQAVFAALQPFVMGGDSLATHQQIAPQLGMKPATVAVAVSRLRERYLKLLREEIAQTVAARGEIDEELRHLAAAISE